MTTTTTTTKTDTKPQRPDPPPAQCANGRHYYDTDGKRIVGDTCRCGQKPIKRMT